MEPNFSATPTASPEVFPMYGCYSGELTDETYLTAEIVQLWEIHKTYEQAVKTDQHRKISVGNTLGQLLYAIKGLLAAPGRGGKWSAWLKERGIPRSTGDRFVQRYAEAHGLVTNRLTDSTNTQQPSEVEISKLATGIWRRVETKLPNVRSRYDLLRCIIGLAGVQYQYTDSGVEVFDPNSEQQPCQTEVQGPNVCGMAVEDAEVC